MLDTTDKEMLAEIGLLTEDSEPGSGYWDRFYAVHGALLEFRQEAYHDVRIYADGYEERDYIGD